jgi:membrane fusion protein (multidrug efflux system)
MVVGEDGTVELRALTLLQDHGADWVVTEGVSAGDKVIVEGLQKAAPGAQVSPQERERTASAAAPAE